MHTFQKPPLILVLVFSIILVWTASCRISVSTVKHAKLCGYAEDPMLIENSIVFVSVINNVLKEWEISPLPNLNPGRPGICFQGYLLLEWLPALAHETIISRVVSEFSSLKFFFGFSFVPFDFPKPSTRQWYYLTHSWELRLQAPGHIHSPVGHTRRTFWCLVSSKTLWFCLGPKGTQFPFATPRRIPYLGYICLTVERLYLASKNYKIAYFFTLNC